MNFFGFKYNKLIKTLSLSFVSLLINYCGSALANPNLQWSSSPTMAQQTTLHSTITQKDYQIFIIAPQQPAPKKGFPVIYLLDGRFTFSLAQSLSDLLVKQKQILPVVIVAIDYPNPEQWLTLRAQDYTPPHNLIPTQNIFLKGEENGGGAAHFLQFINTELKPIIEQKYPINQNQQALFGHSYGGLFTLYTLFTQPDSFQYYYAASPSIWWDNKAILREVKQFKNNTPHHMRKLIISVGGLEQTPPVNSDEERKQKLIERKQIDNAQRLAKDLQQTLADKLQTQFFIFPEQNHGTVIPPSIQKALIRFFPDVHPHH